MRIPLAVLFSLFFVSTAQAGVPCSLPFQLQNNQIADATQVMANYNAIITCLQNAAAAGSNSDITALNALSTPIPPASGGMPIGAVLDFAGAMAPSGYLLAQGQCVSTTTFGALYAVIGDNFTAQNACGSANFGIPDLRSRVSVGLDNGTGRISAVGGNFDTTAFAAVGGAQNRMLTVGQIPTLGVTTGNVSGGTVTGGTVTSGSLASGTLASANIGSAPVSAATVSSSGNNTITVTAAYTLSNTYGTGATTAVSQNGTGGSTFNSAAVNSITVSGTASGQTATCTGCVGGGTVTGTVSGQTVSGQTVSGQTVAGQQTVGYSNTPLPTVQPTMVLNKIIKF
jgi:microcystin-dependent protein